MTDSICGVPDRDQNRESGTAEGATAPRVSIVILSWNALSVVQRCLPSVVATSYSNFEILFADNASTDGSADWVAKTFPSIRVIRNEENLRFTRGNNAAVRHATGSYVVLLNNDVEVEPDWLDPLVKHMESEPLVGAVQPKLLQYSDRTRFEYAGGAGGYLDRYGYPFTRGRLFFDLELDQGQYDNTGPIFWATGAAMMVRRDMYQAMGGLEELFDMHMEEIDFCWRLHRIGRRVDAVPSAHVYHIGGASLPSSSPEKTYLNFRNNLLTLYRNWPTSIWMRRFPIRIALDFVAVARALIRGRPKESGAILRAYIDAHRMRKRVSTGLPDGPDFPDSEMKIVDTPYRGSIILDYFLRRRRRFSDLPSAHFRSDFSDQ